MLNQLPNEIALRVLSHLSKADLLACVTVNQSLYRLATPLLYRHVCSTDSVRTNQGLEFLCNKQAIAQHVHHIQLRLDQEFNNMDKFQLIPQMCSNLRELHVNADHDLGFNITTRMECQHTLQRLSVKECGGSFVSGLLQSAIFTALTSLDIRFLQYFWAGGSVIITSRGDPDQPVIDIGRNIIRSLANAPNLTVLNISYAKFDLNDMESLHNNLPNLKELSLINACFPTTSTTIQPTTNATTIRPLIKFKSFSLTLRPDLYRVTMIQELEHTLQQWLTYMEHKYTKLTAIKMRITCSGDNEFNLVNMIRHNIYTAAKNHMQRIVSKLDGVERIETQLFPFTESNVHLCSKHNLQAVGFFDSEINIKHQMKHLNNSKQINSIHSVSMFLRNEDHYDNDTALQRLFSLYRWDQLTNIDIRSLWGVEFFGLEYKFSLHLLQYVPSLEVLKASSINVVDENMPNLPPNRLKCLHIYRFCIRQHWQASNNYLQAILQASPYLETFTTTLLFQHEQPQFRFVVDLTNNKSLKSVCIEYFSSSACLILEHDLKRTEKYWKTLTTSIKEPSNINSYTLIDLRWNDETKLVVYPVPPPGHA